MTTVLGWNKLRNKEPRTGMLNFNTLCLLSKTHHLPIQLSSLDVTEKPPPHLLPLSPNHTMHYQLFSWLGQQIPANSLPQQHRAMTTLSAFLEQAKKNMSHKQSTRNYSPDSWQHLANGSDKSPSFAVLQCLSSAIASQQSLAWLCIMYTAHMHTPQNSFGIWSRKCHHCNG